MTTQNKVNGRLMKRDPPWRRDPPRVMFYTHKKMLCRSVGVTLFAREHQDPHAMQLQAGENGLPSSRKRRKCEFDVKLTADFLSFATIALILSLVMFLWYGTRHLLFTLPPPHPPLLSWPLWRWQTCCRARQCLRLCLCFKTPRRLEERDYISARAFPHPVHFWAKVCTSARAVWWPGADQWNVNSLLKPPIKQAPCAASPVLSQIL